MSNAHLTINHISIAHAVAYADPGLVHKRQNSPVKESSEELEELHMCSQLVNWDVAPFPSQEAV